VKLVAFLLLSYALSYLLHMPVHGGFTNPIIPAAVPWSIAAAVAVRCALIGRTRRAAWITLLATCAFFLLAHLIPNG